MFIKTHIKKLTLRRQVISLMVLGMMLSLSILTPHPTMAAPKAPKSTGQTRSATCNTVMHYAETFNPSLLITVRLYHGDGCGWWSEVTSPIPQNLCAWVTPTLYYPLTGKKCANNVTRVVSTPMLTTSNDTYVPTAYGSTPYGWASVTP